MGWKFGATSSLQEGQERRGGCRTRRRHGRQKTCWQGRTQGSENPSRQTGQEVPNLCRTNKIKTLAGAEIVRRGGRDLSSGLTLSSWRELRIRISCCSIAALLTSGESCINRGKNELKKP